MLRGLQKKKPNKPLHHFILYEKKEGFSGSCFRSPEGSQRRSVLSEKKMSIAKAMLIQYRYRTHAQPRLYMKRAQINEDANIDNALSEPVISIGKNTYRFTVNVRFELK